MIPKKIHYCWLNNGDEIPQIFQKCMATWKKYLPDYEFVLWDADKFDINSAHFVKQACSVKKWAFASDYIRMYALYTQGGIYLDMDVVLKRGLDEYLNYGFFTSVENAGNGNNDPHKIYSFDDGTVIQVIGGLGILSAVMGAQAGHPFLKSCLEWYENKNFIQPDNTYTDYILSPDIYASIAYLYGFRYKDEKQIIAAHNMVFFKSNVFATNILKADKNSTAIHIGYGSWREKNIKQIPFVNMIIRNNFIRKLCGKKEFIAQENLFDYAQNIGTEEN